VIDVEEEKGHYCVVVVVVVLEERPDVVNGRPAPLTPTYLG